MQPPIPQLASLLADALLDNHLAFNPKARASFRVMLAQNTVFVAGKVTYPGCIHVQDVVRGVLRRVFENDCAENFTIIPLINEVGADVNCGVEPYNLLEQGAEVNTVVLGYATNDAKKPLLMSDFADSLSGTCGIKRAATYAARHIAKNLVAADISDEVLVHIAYTEGIASPVSFVVNTSGKSRVSMPDSEITEKVRQIFDLRPMAIMERLRLRNPIYYKTASHGHFGQQPQIVSKTFHSRYAGEKSVDVDLFTWDRVNYVGRIKSLFGQKYLHNSK
jgi:S-adenosylmethionine synthetase